MVEQLVMMWFGAPVVPAVQVCTGTLFVTLAVLQVRVTQLLPEAAVCGEQEATGTLVVLLVLQVRVTQLLPEAAVCGVQLETGTLVVTMSPGQVVVVQLLPALAVIGEQVPGAIGTFV